MKKLAFIMMLSALFASNLFSQASYESSHSSLSAGQATVTVDDKFSIKLQPFMGTYVDKSRNIKNLNPEAPTGLNFGLEFPSMQQRPWQQYLNNPTVGLGLSYIDFGTSKNPQATAQMGKSIAMYPYILINGVNTEHFNLDVKLASGLGLVTEHWYTQNDTDPDHYHDASTNTTFGCYLNAYLSAGLNMNFPITPNMAINGEIGYLHMSNGRTCMPNVGANIIYGGLGFVATMNADKERPAIHFPDQPYRWSVNLTAAAGAQKAAIKDENRFLISSLHAGAIYHVNNWYGVGAGLDVFYNDAISADTDRGLYRKDIDYTTMDKVRAGVALNNEFKFGVLTAILDWGVYLYNPSRNYYARESDHYEYGEKRPLFYKSSSPGSEEACHYIRFGMKYRIFDNLYLQTTAKTHLQICEYVEFGLGYQIPFLEKNKRKGEQKIFHYHKNWWKSL